MHAVYGQKALSLSVCVCVIEHKWGFDNEGKRYFSDDSLFHSLGTTWWINVVWSLFYDSEWNISNQLKFLTLKSACRLTQFFSPGNFVYSDIARKFCFLCQCDCSTVSCWPSCVIDYLLRTETEHAALFYSESWEEVVLHWSAISQSLSSAGSQGRCCLSRLRLSEVKRTMASSAIQKQLLTGSFFISFRPLEMSWLYSSLYPTL